MFTFNTLIEIVSFWYQKIVKPQNQVIHLYSIHLNEGKNNINNNCQLMTWHDQTNSRYISLLVSGHDYIMPIFAQKISDCNSISYIVKGYTSFCFGLHQSLAYSFESLNRLLISFWFPAPFQLLKISHYTNYARICKLDHQVMQ